MLGARLTPGTSGDPAHTPVGRDATGMPLDTAGPPYLEVALGTIANLSISREVVSALA